MNWSEQSSNFLKGFIKLSKRSYIKLLTANGMELSIIGHFRPNLFEINPEKIFPKSPARHKNDTTELDSSTEIAPVGNGDSSDMSKATYGLAQPSFWNDGIYLMWTIWCHDVVTVEAEAIRNSPSVIPKLRTIKFAVCELKISFSLVFAVSLQFIFFVVSL